MWMAARSTRRSTTRRELWPVAGAVLGSGLFRFARARPDTSATVQRRAPRRLLLVSLARNVLTGSAYLLVAVMTILPATACILPPEGLAPPAPAFAPKVDFSALRPLQPLLRVTPNCGTINLEVNQIIDFDSRNLRVRWVANNNLPNTHLIWEEELVPVDPGSLQRATWRLVVSEDLDVDGDGGLENGDTVVLSFFVTDAERFEAPAPPSVRGRGDTLDLGSVDPALGSMVEVRWTFSFSPLGDCQF